MFILLLCMIIVLPYLFLFFSEFCFIFFFFVELEVPFPASTQHEPCVIATDTTSILCLYVKTQLAHTRMEFTLSRKGKLGAENTRNRRDWHVCKHFISSAQAQAEGDSEIETKKKREKKMQK